MRLIDADALIDKLKELGWIEDTPLDEIINEQPTAYDVEKVVKELEEKYPTKMMPKSWGLPYCLGCGQKLDWQ